MMEPGTRRFAARVPPVPRDFAHVTAHDGTRIYCETYGDPAAPALVLSDGIACNGTFFVHLIPVLATRFRVVRWAYRGHGLSEAPREFGHLTMEDNLRDLQSVLGHLGIGEAIHLGYSLGVPLVLDLACRQPEAVRGLILLCGSPGRLLDDFHGRSLLRSLLPIGYSIVVGNKPQVSGLVRRLVPTRLAYVLACLVEFDPRLVRYDDLMPYLEHVAALDLELFLTMLASAGEHDMRPGLPGIRCPTLVVGGREDQFTPAYLSEEIFQAIPAAELLVVPGATHVLPVEQPDLVNLRIEQFLVAKGFWGNAVPIHSADS